MAGPSHLKPGEKGVITAQMAALPSKGVAMEKIEVESNDPRKPKAILTLRANIIEKNQP